MSTRYCLLLDLKDDATAISEYDRYHREVWPEIQQSIRDAGIRNMQIYRSHNRLFMIMETAPGFSFDAKGKADAANPKVQQWEKLMENYQQRLPWAGAGEKWILMEKVFELDKG